MQARKIFINEDVTSISEVSKRSKEQFRFWNDRIGVYFYYQERSKLLQTDTLLPIFDTRSIFKAATMLSPNGFTSY